MYHQLEIQQFYVVPTHSGYVFCMDLEEPAIISLYSINWVLFNGDLTF
jgi:hypothetical protein